MIDSFDYGLFNIGSIVLGLVAWILPTINLIRYNKGGQKNWITFSILSISACSISLWFQIVYNHHLVEIEDWSALMDTTGSLVKVSAVLIIVTILFNIINLSLYKERLPK